MLRTLLCLPLCLLLAPSYPGEVEWRSGDTRQVAGDRKVEGLPDPARDVLGFLDACLKRYDQKVKGYTLVFEKQERVNGKKRKPEVLEVCYQDEPLSVRFDWKVKGNSLADVALYVAGKNVGADGRSQIVTLSIIGEKEIATDSSFAKDASRYTMDKFGLRQATQKIVDGWRAAAKEKALHVEYGGLHEVPQAGGRVCHKIRRYKFAKPENDGITEVIIFIDRETLLQVGSIVLRGDVTQSQDERLLGEYYFHHIQLNPAFGPGVFERPLQRK
jgi:hypothetical protein